MRRQLGGLRGDRGRVAAHPAIPVRGVERERPVHRQPPLQLVIEVAHHLPGARGEPSARPGRHPLRLPKRAQHGVGRPEGAVRPAGDQPVAQALGAARRGVAAGWQMAVIIFGHLAEEAAPRRRRHPGVVAQHPQVVPDHPAEQPAPHLVGGLRIFGTELERVCPVLEDLEMPLADGAGDRARAPLPVVHAGTRQRADPPGGHHEREGERDVLVPAGGELEAEPQQQAPPDHPVPRHVQDVENLRPLVHREHRRRLAEQFLGRAGLHRPVPVHPVPAHHQHVRVGGPQPFADRGERAGGQPVVTVHKPDVLTGRVPQAEVAGPAQADVLRRGDHPDPGVAGGVLGEDGAAVVRRAVVHRDDLEVGERPVHQ
jgi:hypothetical protein